MKLNPPETAPKKATAIMACVNGIDLYPAVWNVAAKVWLVAYATLGGHFAVCPIPYKSVTGWLPMPQIDEEGNVT